MIPGFLKNVKIEKTNANIYCPIESYTQKDYEERQKAKNVAESLEKQGYKVAYGRSASTGKACAQIIGKLEDMNC